LYAEAMSIGEVRGYVNMNQTPESDRIGPLGDGLLKVQRVLYGEYEPVMGIVALRRGDVTSDLSHYLTQSEQIPSVFVIDVDYNQDETIRECAGLLIQAMPGARPEDLFAVYDKIDYLERLTAYIDRGSSPEDILREVLPGEITIVTSSPVDYFCRCSQDKFKSLLLTLGLDEVQAMRTAGQNELVCQYCASKYYLSDDDFIDLEQRLQASRN
jgi:molecular chaperone Hsp33